MSSPQHQTEAPRTFSFIPRALDALASEAGSFAVYREPDGMVRMTRQKDGGCSAPENPARSKDPVSSWRLSRPDRTRP